MYFGKNILLGSQLQSYQAFKDALGQRESGNNYSIVNPYGYMGKYQFGMARLKELGYTGTRQAFISSPDLQEQYFDLHVQDHAQHLSGLVNTAKNNIGGSVTLSGLIGGAHLLGRGGVNNYVNNGVDKTDANGTHISSYVSQFSGYEIPNYDENSGLDLFASMAIPDTSGDGSAREESSGGFDFTTLGITAGAVIGTIILLQKI